MEIKSIQGNRLVLSINEGTPNDNAALNATVAADKRTVQAQSQGETWIASIDRPLPPAKR